MEYLWMGASGIPSRGNSYYFFSYPENIIEKDVNEQYQA